MNPHTRLSDADRDRAAADLAEHYAQGRLDAEEHAERLDAIWTARTRADLDPIFEDLPARAPERPARGQRRGWQPVPFLPIVAVLVVLSIVTHLPFWILIFFVGCGLFTRRRMHSWHRTV
ncbi:MAG TPA: DUF1707 domain-containing protein [Nocardioides sp.]|nr:DUF1707 domain-containing protein [Nocardioides sp.]